MLHAVVLYISLLQLNTKFSSFLSNCCKQHGHARQAEESTLPKSTVGCKWLLSSLPSAFLWNSVH